MIGNINYWEQYILLTLCGKAKQHLSFLYRPAESNFNTVIDMRLVMMTTMTATVMY